MMIQSLVVLQRNTRSKLVDGNTDADIVGGVLLKGREVFSHDVTSPDAFVELVAAAS